MNGKDLFEAMSYVDERFVDEAENEALPKRIASPWIKVASMAACLCLVLFGRPYLNRAVTEGAAGQEAVDSILDGEIENELEQESQEAVVISPGDSPTGEVPSVILYVNEMTELGFIGTVAERTDTDLLEIGMELNVIVADGTRHETAAGDPAMSAELKTDYSGAYVMVQFIKYDAETKTIIVNVIQEADAPETAP